MECYKNITPALCVDTEENLTSIYPYEYTIMPETTNELRRAIFAEQETESVSDV